uniref:Transmembrane protein n=1 Tax=Kalanchoe fedtschenkoi TaxID=63787 RepID=A0A7N0ULK9_KALFE
MVTLGFACSIPPSFPVPHSLNTKIYPKSSSSCGVRFLPPNHPSSISIATLAKKTDGGEDPMTAARDDSDGPPPRLLGLDFKWADLLNPDADNVLAVGLTGLLTWASVQVLWQLLFISLAILVAAVKYSFIAALLLFILITLL